MWTGANRSASIVIGSITLLLTFLYPITFCLGCEPPPAWQNNDIPDFVLWWLGGAPFLAVLCAWPRRLLVPLATVLGVLLSQPGGGAPASSFLINEWPVIILFGTPIAFLCFGAGVAARKIVDAAYFAFRI